MWGTTNLWRTAGATHDGCLVDLTVDPTQKSGSTEHGDPDFATTGKSSRSCCYLEEVADNALHPGRERRQPLTQIRAECRSIHRIVEQRAEPLDDPWPIAG